MNRKSIKHRGNRQQMSLKIVSLPLEIDSAMKRAFFFLFFVGLASLVMAQEHRCYVLAWHDEFDGNSLDDTAWSKIWRSQSDWAMHMSSHDTLYAIEDGDLVLRGVRNDFLPGDTASFLTGGVWSRYKKSFGLGRLEIRAKFDVAQGYWPAIWMLPQTHQALNWPYGGEIDIMEHFDDSPAVSQTVHSHYTYNLGKGKLPPQTADAPYREGDYNVYAVELYEDSLVFFVNDTRTLRYPRFRKGVDGQFPFSQHNFFLILDAQLGRRGGPSIDTTCLPVELRVDYVRYYEVDTSAKVIYRYNSHSRSR